MYLENLVKHDIRKLELNDQLNAMLNVIYKEHKDQKILKFYDNLSVTINYFICEKLRELVQTHAKVLDKSIYISMSNRPNSVKGSERNKGLIISEADRSSDLRRQFVPMADIMKPSKYGAKVIIDEGDLIEWEELARTTAIGYISYINNKINNEVLAENEKFHIKIGNKTLLKIETVDDGKIIDISKEILFYKS
ncbi:hypothetical protein [Enterococcus casseliflavus]|uniref:hypothetical protein n=1 Tax=Enterococcus casseliflavus TaxID=37734 RepID=UPI0030191789